jgi:hypothetical protein
MCSSLYQFQLAATFNFAFGYMIWSVDDFIFTYEQRKSEDWTTIINSKYKNQRKNLVRSGI